MRILYITASLPFGPGETFLIPEVEALERQGHSIVVMPLCSRGPVMHSDAARLLPITINDELLSPDILWKSILETLRSPLAVFRAFGVILSSRSLRILVKNAAAFPKSLWAGAIARKHRIDHIHAHWGSCTATMGMIASRTSGIPWSFTVHSWEIAEDNLLHSKSQDAVFVRAISKFGERRLERNTSKPPVSLHIGVDMPARLAQQRHVNDGSSFQVAVIGSLLPIKGHTYLFRAWKLLQSRGVAVHVDVVGDGPLRKQLEAEIEKLGAASHIRLLGNISHAELLDFLADARWQAVVLPSVIAYDHEQEGIPISLLESMARGIPVVSTETGGIPELLEGGAGLLVPSNDPIALADAIESIATSSSLRREFGERGRRRVLEEFSVEKIAHQLAKWMQSPHAATEEDSATVEVASEGVTGSAL